MKSLRKIFSGHLLGQYWTENSMYRTWIGLNWWKLQIYYFRVILGRRIQIRREKKIRTTPWASTGLVISIILTISPVLTQRGAKNISSRRIRILHPKITLGWCIERLCYLISDEVQIYDYLGPLLAAPASNLEAPYFF